MIKIVQRIYLIAGIYGLIALFPQYFLENKTSIDYPPAITHPDLYYGFIGVALAWQIAFIIISRDPVRYKPIMIAAILEKLSYGLATVILYLLDRIPTAVVIAGSLDLFIMCLFVFAYIKTPDLEKN